MELLQSFWWVAPAALCIVMVMCVILHIASSSMDKNRAHVESLFSKHSPEVAELKSLHYLIGDKNYSWPHAMTVINKIRAKKFLEELK